MSEPSPECCENTSGKMFWGILFLGVGILLLLQNLDILYFSETWPVILIVVGLAMMLGMFGRKKTPRGTVDSAQSVPKEQDLPNVS